MRMFYKILGTAGFFLAFAATANAATLTLSPSSQTLNVGDTLTVDIMLDTQGAPIDGVDLKSLNYNPYNLQMQDANASVSGTQLTPGTLMPNTLANSADTTNGKIAFSQVTNGGSTYTGSGKLATVVFKALVAGTPTLKLDFTPGSTVDTNVASKGADVLTSVVNGQYTINNSSSPVTSVPGGSQPGSPAGSPGSTGGVLRLINDNGTFYLVKDGQRRGITNPGMLFSYGFTFSQAKLATAADRLIPEGPILLPNNGALVKSAQDPTVYLISRDQRHGFISANVFLTLGFKFSSVLVVTNPELQKLPIGIDVADPLASHFDGLDINDRGTIYLIMNQAKYGYPTMKVYNSWHIPNDMSKIVPANAADRNLPMGTIVEERKLE